MMLQNNFKKSFVEDMNDNLEEMHYVFSDLGQAIIKLSATAKKYNDEQSLAWLRDLEHKLFSIKEKIEKLNLVFKPLLRAQITVINNTLAIETKRLKHLKHLVVKHGEYEYSAALHEIENDINEVLKCTDYRHKTEI